LAGVGIAAACFQLSAVVIDLHAPACPIRYTWLTVMSFPVPYSNSIEFIPELLPVGFSGSYIKFLAFSPFWFLPAAESFVS